MPEVQSVTRLRVYWLGRALKASMEITVDCDMTVTQNHRVSEVVRHRLLHEVRRLDTAMTLTPPLDTMTRCRRKPAREAATEGARP